ncbi:putative flavodoxin [Proteus penneri ATCC 35198]|nr:putative flavodoxin [Proteus penneri ATCC 35198]
MAQYLGNIANIKFKNKLIAMYGMGDQVDYSEWFLDALGMLYHHLLPSGVKFIGFWPVDGYEFISPKPLSDDGKHFVGLALDDVNQFEETDERLSQWCMQILREIEENL